MKNLKPTVKILKKIFKARAEEDLKSKDDEKIYKIKIVLYQILLKNKQLYKHQISAAVAISFCFFRLKQNNKILYFLLKQEKKKENILATLHPTEL